MRPIVARDLMSPDVLTVKEDWPISKLAGFLAEHDITGAPVVDRDDFVVGVVSMVDIVREFGWSDDSGGYLYVPDRMINGLPEVRLIDEEALVGDLMTPDPETIDPEAGVSEIAMIMLRKHLHRLLVVEDGTLVGIISTSDLLGLLVEESDQ